MATLTGKYIDNVFESDSGSGNGATVAFVLSNTPHSQTNVKVFVNGIRQQLTTDYSVTLATKTITFVTAPANGQSIDIDYIKV